MREIFQNWCLARRIMNSQSILESLCMMVLESLKDIVKEWINCVNLNLYGHMLQYQLCEEVLSNFSYQF